MKRLFLSLFVVLSVFCSVAQGRLSEVGPGYCRTSVNTAVFRAGSLATHGDVQYVSYYDPEGYVTVGKRQLDSDEWAVNRTQRLLADACRCVRHHTSVMGMA